MGSLGGKYLTFILDNETYGIPIKKVKEIIGLMEITHIPKTQQHVKGVINLRGKIIPVMDLRLKFAMVGKPYNDRTCIIVIESNQFENNRLMGVIVDTVAEVINIQQSQIEDPGCDAQIEGGFLTGLGKLKDSVILILDIDQIFNLEDFAGMKKGLSTEEALPKKEPAEVSLG